MTPDDFLHLLAAKSDRRISFTENIAYKDAGQLRIFTQEFWGVLAGSPRGEGNSIEQLVEFDGYTIAERHDQGRNSHDPKDYVWYQFAQWFSKEG